MASMLIGDKQVRQQLFKRIDIAFLVSVDVKYLYTVIIYSMIFLKTIVYSYQLLILPTINTTIVTPKNYLS